MQTLDGRLIYSATDLVAFLECRHLSHLERAVAEGWTTRPMREDPVLDRIAKRGIEHEQRFLATLESAAEGLRVVKVGRDESLPRREQLLRGAEETQEAMRAGADVIYQAVLLDERRQGYADFLRRVERPSDLGGWAYEVWDTKLARHPKASAVLQLCLYSEMVGAMQGVEPERMHLALGGREREVVSFRVAEYAAYYRSVARDFEALLDAGSSYPPPTFPEPVEHCDVCRWQPECSKVWRRTNDLALVAGLSSRHRRALHEAGVTTLPALAEMPLPPEEPIEGIGRDAFTRIREQARVQAEGDRIRGHYFERIPPLRDREGALVPNHGLGMLPPPSEGDLFFDIEGDPFYSSDAADGLDYLFGVIEPREVDADGQPRFHAFWSVEDGPDGPQVTGAAERRAFEQFIDLVMDRLERDPGLHIYHYAPYETTAVKRLAQRYGTRESEVDQLLRGEVFVDLYRAVRQGIRAAVESYSIKRLEQFYGYRREVELKQANESIVEFETWLELGGTSGAGAERERILANIEAYNRDDCLSTLRLHDWLEEQRAALVEEDGVALERPRVVEPEEREDTERQKEVAALVEALMAGVPDPPDDDSGATPEQRGRWLLAQLLNWHRREQKAGWWRYFYLKNELTDEERREESDALGGLRFVTSWPDPAPRARSTIYRFRFPPQDHKFEVGQRPHDPDRETESGMGTPVGTIFAIDDEAGTIDLRLGRDQPAPSPTSLIAFDDMPSPPQPRAIERVARGVLDGGIEGDGPYRAGRDLLLRTPPRIDGHEPGAPLLGDGEDAQAAARRLALALDESYLAIQGPPGSGKTTVGAEMIVDLVAAEQRVAVTAGSHKVIGNLLEAVAKTAERRGVPVRIGQRPGRDGAPTYEGAVTLTSNGNVFDALASGEVDVAGATTWVWSREEAEGCSDILVVDEAGQMSLADALAASTCARNLVLLGDPQQLDQPLKGTHPPGAGRSALAHLLGDHATMPREYGLFLDGTWRLHPRITAYTSEVFYDGRLGAHPGREQQAVRAPSAPLFDGAGLRFLPVAHVANQSESVEEAEAIREALDALFAATPAWTDDTGREARLSGDDVLLITPYNAQVRALRDALGERRIGTVDKFQGQQAPISIYSMATSSAEDAPRGMEFLYSLNRLNVATSRARCIALVVASPGLLAVRCRTPRQMRLANALARLVEYAAEA